MGEVRGAKGGASYLAKMIAPWERGMTVREISIDTIPESNIPGKVALMNLSKKVLNTISAVAILLGMTAGMASAADNDTENTILNVTCPVTPSVTVATSGAFSVDTSSAALTYDAHGVVFTIVMDLTCSWSDDFQVSATIGTFNFQGVAPAGTQQTLSGAHLLWNGGSGVYVGPTIPLISGAPDVEGTVFEFFQVSDPDAIENDTLFGFFDLAAPGVTTATWNGHLIALPGNLAVGQYVAPLTVVLTVN